MTRTSRDESIFREPAVRCLSLIHIFAKIIATSATIGGALPNSGAMFGMLAAMGLNHKNSYKHIAAISIGAGLCALIVMIVMANIGIV